LTKQEVWLRGPVEGVPAELQPVAHAFTQLLEDVTRVVPTLSEAELWTRPGGAASIGFHMTHMAGSIDRLLTYARGEALGERQYEALANESNLQPPHPSMGELLLFLSRTIETSVGQLRATEPRSLLEARAVGRAKLSSTVLGLLFHAAEHAQKHTGQILTTAKILRGNR
jgi:uncharacterized damage-inducible protein DinB